MIPSRRSSLHPIARQNKVHPGLWFDKFLAKQPEKAQNDSLESYNDLIKECGRHLNNENRKFYDNSFKRWQTSLKTASITTAEAISTNSRLAIGLGSESVIETAIAIHHTYGVPYLPGSALKGMTAAYARNYLTEAWVKQSNAYKTLFGTTDQQGIVTFYDALPLPRKWNLTADIITVHHPNYYQTEQDPPPPADWDNPTPIPFLTATGTFLIPLAGPPEWVNAAFKIMALALKEIGIGAKTSSGYGRLQLDWIPPSPPTPQEQFSAAYQQCLSLPDHATRQEKALELVEQIMEAGLETELSAEDWYKELEKLALE